MIELLIFYWIFSILFMIGCSEEKANSLKILIVTLSPILMPIAFGILLTEIKNKK